jgi:hypothetical protein
MGSIFKTPKMKIEKPPPEVAMPDPEDLKSRMAKRSMMMDAKRRRGRESTILGPTVAEGGGGKEFGSSTLGGGAA